MRLSHFDYVIAPAEITVTAVFLSADDGQFKRQLEATFPGAVTPGRAAIARAAVGVPHYIRKYVLGSSRLVNNKI